MQIKTKSTLFRDMLYLNDLVKFSKISTIAEKNGIKQSNLSKIIKDLEDITQTQLFKRTNKGLIPTAKAISLSKSISKIEIQFEEIITKMFNYDIKQEILLYVPKNIYLKNLHLFTEAKIVLSDDEHTADVSVSYNEPLNTDELITVENTIGTDFKQTIWISSVNSKPALNLARFIICQMHL